MKKQKLDEFHYHEAMDRTSMLCDILAMQLITHPVFNEHKHLKDKLELAIDALYNVYSDIGGEIIIKFNDKETTK